MAAQENEAALHLRPMRLSTWFPRRPAGARMLPAESGEPVGGCSSPVDHGVRESEAPRLVSCWRGPGPQPVRQEQQRGAGLGGEAETSDSRACAPCQSPQRGRDILVKKKADGARGVRKTSSRTEQGTKAPGSAFKTASPRPVPQFPHLEEQDRCSTFPDVPRRV